MSVDPKPYISVLICTYNRCQSLKEVLENILCQETEGLFDFEVIVVDNNSKDETKETFISIKEKSSIRLEYIFEPRQGKSYALNSGIKNAKGEVVACIDDDVIVAKDYLINIYKAFKENSPAIGFMGGRISPHWVNCTRPEWLPDFKSTWFSYFWGPLGILDYGETPFVVHQQQIDSNERRIFYGANIAFRKELLLKYGGFNLSKLVAEDTEIQMRFLEKGEQGFYVPKMQVLAQCFS